MSEPAARQRTMINLDEFERRLGRPAAPARNNEDPLAELARLVGGTEDRYRNVFQARSPAPAAPPRYTAERAPASEPRTSAPIARPRRLGGDFATIEAGLRSTFTPEFRAPPSRELAPEPEPDIDADDWLDAPYLPPPPVAEAPRSRLPLYATAAIIVFGMAGIGASFALKRHSITPHEIAMIKADQGPTKIQASYTGDAPKPDQDASVLNNSPQPAPVAVVSHSEEPTDLSAAPQAPANQQASASQTPPAAAPAAVVPVPAPPAAEGQGQALSLAGMIEPKKVKTVAVRPDGTIVSNDSPNPAPDIAAPQPAPQAAAQQIPGITPVGPAPVQLDATDAAPKTTKRVATGSPETDASAGGGDNDNAAPAATPETHPARAKPVNLADADTDATGSIPQGRATSFAVQLSAPGSEKEARQSLTKFQKEYGSELSGYRLKYHLAKVADKSVYRVRVVGLSHEEATALCQKLQAKGGSCFVARN
jgi:hypothetical protein